MMASFDANDFMTYGLFKKKISVALFEKPLYKIIETTDCLTDIE
jgi:hypothetical protein